MKIRIGMNENTMSLNSLWSNQVMKVCASKKINPLYYKNETTYFIIIPIKNYLVPLTKHPWIHLKNIKDKHTL